MLCGGRIGNLPCIGLGLAVLLVDNKVGDTLVNTVDFRVKDIPD